MVKLTALASQDWMNIQQLSIPVFKTKKIYFIKTFFTTQDGLDKHSEVVKTYYFKNGNISGPKFKDVFLLDILHSCIYIFKCQKYSFPLITQTEEICRLSIHEHFHHFDGFYRSNNLLSVSE